MGLRLNTITSAYSTLQGQMGACYVKQRCVCKMCADCHIKLYTHHNILGWKCCHPRDTCTAQHDMTLVLALQDGILPEDFNDMLQSILPSAPYTLSSGSTDECKQYLDASDKSCTTSLSAETATYQHDDRIYPVTICICQGGPYDDVKGLADEVARIPEFLLYFVKGIVHAIATSWHCLHLFISSSPH